MKLLQSAEERLRQSLAPSTRILCAISGGPDSVALAHVLKGMPYPVVLGHVDHRMRVNSASDARFVQTLAQKWDLPYKAARVNAPAYAAVRKKGLEEAARELRYQALERMARQANCAAIVTAHTADDQAETVLMNFLRGAGPSGLCGIPADRSFKSGVRVLRPLLACTRVHVMDYLRDHRLPYRQDPSNRSPRFTRNRIRHHLLPYLETDYPGLRKRLVQMGEIFRDEQSFWDPNIQREIIKTARQNNQKITVDLTQLLGYHRALGRRILRHLLTGISFQDTERIFQLALSGNGHLPIQLSGGMQVMRKGNELIIRKQDE